MQVKEPLCTVLRMLCNYIKRRREQTQAHAAASLPEGPGKQCKQGLLAHACHSVPFWRAAAAATAQACALARA
eukprot:scaffold63938_cov18-Tisochrysis_lutea.AAC.3